ncbi:MAG: hypothetical protein HY887_03365 [Deltaproteobacteria bacterium]|nr:hypothetical protein [Deltaproteobacteria bacterium]
MFKVDSLFGVNINFYDRFAGKINSRTFAQVKEASDVVIISEEGKKNHIMGQIVASMTESETSKK